MKKINEQRPIVIAIIVAAIILGIALVKTQESKQESIERQVKWKIEQENQEQADKNKQDRIEFRQEECKSLSSGVKKAWHNVVGVTYNPTWDECVVTYTDTDTGEIETSPLKYMETVY